MELTFEKLMVKYSRDVEALRAYMSLAHPVSHFEVLDRMVRFMGAMLPLADAEEDATAMRDHLGNFVGAFNALHTAGVSSDPADNAGDPLPELSALAASGINEPELLDSFQNFVLSQEAIPRIHGALLVTLISTFEFFLADTLHAYYRLQPKALLSEDKVFSTSQLWALGSLETAFNHVAEQRVEKILWGGPEDRRKALSEHGVDLNALLPGDWADWEEVFLRRNLIIHNNGRVNDSYLTRLGAKGSGLQVGGPLPVDRTYLSRAIDLFAVAGVNLANAMWYKSAKDESERRVHVLVDQVLFQQMLTGKWQLVEAICRHALGMKGNSASQATMLRINLWLAMKRQGYWTEVSAEVGSIDVSQYEPKYALCILSLRDQPAEFFALLPHSGITTSELNAWPALAEMRSRPEFNSYAKSMFPDWE